MSSEKRTASAPADAFTVSVVIPAFNSARYIGEALLSVFAQTVLPREVVVVDDGSRDDLEAAVAPFRDRIVFIRQANAGVSAARNRGAAASSGAWLQFVDADDRLYPDAIERLLETARAGDCGVVYGGVTEFFEDGRPRIPRGGPFCEGAPPLPAKMNFRRANIVTPGAAIVRRKLHNAVGGFTKPWQPTEDRDYWMKLGVLTRFCFCESPVIDKRAHAGQATERYDQTLNLGLRVQLEYLPWLRERGIDSSFLGATRETIADEALRRAYTERRWRALRLMRATLESHGIRTPYMEQVLRRTRWPRAPFVVCDTLRRNLGRVWDRVLGRKGR